MSLQLRGSAGQEFRPGTDGGLSWGDWKGQADSKSRDLIHLEALSLTGPAPGRGWLEGSAVNPSAYSVASPRGLATGL